MFDSGFAYYEVTIACAAVGWHLVHAWYDGTTLSIGLDDGTPATTPAATDMTTLADTNPLWFGKNYDGTKLFNGKIADIILADVDLGGTARTNIKSYCNSLYALSL